MVAGSLQEDSGEGRLQIPGDGEVVRGPLTLLSVKWGATC